MEMLMNLLKQQNPEMASYFEMMKPMMEQKAEPENTAYEEVESKPVADESDKLRKINQKLFSIVDYLKQQVNHEVKRNDDLAKAIGACPECFGQDTHCLVCRGFGKAGYFVPDFILFNRFVQPAVQSFQQHFQKLKN